MSDLARSQGEPGSREQSPQAVSAFGFDPSRGPDLVTLSVAAKAFVQAEADEARERNEADGTLAAIQAIARESGACKDLLTAALEANRQQNDRVMRALVARQYAQAKALDLLRCLGLSESHADAPEKASP